MKDTKTVLPTVNGNIENKNGYHSKQKNSDHDEVSSSEQLMKPTEQSEELVGGCCVCSDDQGFANNALVYCDGKGCTVACHTACYGIVTIPDGDWYCDRCEAGDNRAACRLCPTVEGAMKRTASGGWAHVVCALYIPEVSFGNNATMEPINLSKIPSTRYGQECSICMENGRSKLISTSGACCHCTVKNCSKVFHVTCAQANGLLCEDVRKNSCQYPIYCEQHRPKLSKFIRQIASFSYSPNSLATEEQISRQNSLTKEKESPAQLSDFLSGPGNDTSSTTTSNVDESNNPNGPNDEQTPVARSSQSNDGQTKKPSSFNTNSSATSTSPNIQQKCHSRSSSTSSSSNSSTQKKVKLHDENSSNPNPNNPSLNDLSQFVQLNRDEDNFVPPLVPPNSNHDKDHGSSSTSKKISQQSSNEEKHSSSRSTMPSKTDGPPKSSNIKQRHSLDSTKFSTVVHKKSTSSHHKNEDHDEDFQLNKKRKIIKFNKDGHPRKYSSDGGGPRPVGRPPLKKNLASPPLINGVKRPAPKSTGNTMMSNAKRSKYNDTLINVQQNRKDHDNEHESEQKPRPTTYQTCDHFGNQISSDVYHQHAHSHEQISPSDTNRTRVPSASTTQSSTTRIDFFPRRPLQDKIGASTSTETQQQRPFPPQTLEEFLEQEWELSSDFLLQQTMPHDVSSLLSCLYQFKSENAALQKKFDELRHRRDSLRVTNANLRRRLSEILPINETLPTTVAASSIIPTSTSLSIPTTIGTSSATVTQISPPVPTISVQPPPPPPPPPPPVPVPVPVPVSVAASTQQQVIGSNSTITTASSLSSMTTIPSSVSPSPRKEQQQLKQQKLLAELELQQQLQQQKSTSPTRRRLSSNTPNSQAESSHSSAIPMKKSKSPRQSTSISQSSLLENQLRQPAMNSTSNVSGTSSSSSIISSSSKKSSSSSNNSMGNTQKKSSIDIEVHGHHSSTTSGNSLPSSVTAPSTASLPYEPIDVTSTAAAAAAAYALAKSGRAAASSPAINLELLTQIFTASGNAMSPQLFAPTWNISNFGYANFPAANPIPLPDETILRSYASAAAAHTNLEQQPSTKPPS